MKLIKNIKSEYITRAHISGANKQVTGNRNRIHNIVRQNFIVDASGYFIWSKDEMAIVGKFSDCKIIINSNDHGSPHVHYLCNGKLVAKIEIPNENVKNQTELTIIKKGLVYNTYLMTNFVKWINDNHPITKTANYNAALAIWDALH